MNVFLTDLKRAIGSRRFFIALFGVALAGFFGSFTPMSIAFEGGISQAAGAIPLQLAYTAVSSDILLMAAPILCTLAYTTAFVEEYKSRFARAYLPRAGRAPYVCSKAAAVAISGGLALFLGILLLCGMFAIAFAGYRPMAEYVIPLDPSLVITFSALVLRALLFFLFGCFWALVGGIISAAGMNKYLAYICPFVIYYVMVILKERYFRDIALLNPQKWLSPDLGAETGSRLLFLAASAVCAGVAYALIMKRRLRNV